MKDQPSTSDDNREPPKPRTIPDDFLWDPELQAWYAPGESGELPPGWLEDFMKGLDEADEDDGPHLITVDDLRAAGVLDVPAWMRKSLRSKPPEPDLFSGLDGDDENPESQKPANGDSATHS